MNIEKKFNLRNKGYINSQLLIGIIIAGLVIILAGGLFLAKSIRKGTTPGILDPIIDPFKPSKPGDPVPPTKPGDPEVPPPTKPELPVKPPVVEGKREDWQIIPVAGAKCGSGEQYVMGFSAGPVKLDGKANSRLVIWMPGGGSTMITEEGTFTTNVGPELGLIRPPKGFGSDQPAEGTGANFIFLNHSDNNLFVRDANWAVLPYCTQDFHSGRLTQPIEYDFTDEPQFVRFYETLLNQNKNRLNQIKEQYPYIRLETHNESGQIKIDKLYISIIHHGAKNVELALSRLFGELDKIGFDWQRSEIIMAGSSAGGFGTWYNAWRIGDKLYRYPNSSFTIVPQSGSPTTRRWNGQDIAVYSHGVDYRLNYYNSITPCGQRGGNYRGGGDCRDTLDLITHYQNRWPDMAFAIIPVVNKEDLVAVNGLGDQNAPDFPAKLLNLCQTIHRYSQYISKIEDVFPYTLWQYRKIGNREVRVHGLGNGLLIAKMTRPNGGSPTEYGIQKMINDVATGKLKWSDYTPQIEHTLNVVTNSTSVENFTLEPRPNHMQSCNVPQPSRERPN